MRRPPPASILGSLWRAFALWLCLALFYLLLVGQLAPAELGAAALTAAAAAVFERMLMRSVERVFALPPGALRLVLRGVITIPGDCLRVGGVVLRRLAGQRPEGRFRQAALRGPRDGARGAGYRALLMATVSLAPNSVAVAVEGGRLVLHELRPSPGAPDAQRETP